jgi:arginine decarboxylase
MSAMTLPAARPAPGPPAGARAATHCGVDVPGRTLPASTSASGILPTAPIRERSVTITLSTGTGTGPTTLAAFDAALCAAGIGEYNLVRLSSVIPPHAELRRTGPQGQLTGRWGDRLFCVYASQIAERPGEQAWAGIGWVLKQDGSGAGLFVEHEGPAEQGVRDDISASLGDMVQRRGGAYSEPQLVLSDTVCVDEPVCALVVAGYETAGWHRG